MYAYDMDADTIHKLTRQRGILVTIVQLSMSTQYISITYSE